MTLLLEEESPVIVLDESQEDEKACENDSNPARWRIICKACKFESHVCDPCVKHFRDLLARTDAIVALMGATGEIECVICGAETYDHDWRTLIEILPL